MRMILEGRMAKIEEHVLLIGCRARGDAGSIEE